MMMQTIREKTRWAIVFLAVAFAAWLAFEGIQSRQTSTTTGSNPVIGVINGEQIQYMRWRDASSAQLDRARAQKGGALTDEETRQAEEQAWENLIRDVLVDQEIERIGIEVSDAEIAQAFRTSPPPFVARSAAFQTDGDFDYEKYQAFFADPSVDEQLLLEIEGYYRNRLPRLRLEEQLAAGVSVTDREAWDEFEADNETAVVTYVTVDPSSVVAESDVQVTEDEARRYYRAHREDFERPATATVRMVSFSTEPTSEDSARVLARVDSLRTSILEEELSFEDAAEASSADTVTASQGGELGRYRPEDLNEPVASAVAGLDSGEVSEPVTTPAGVHLFRVTDPAEDSVTVSHILFEMTLSEQTEDELFGRMDDVEGIALDQGLLAARDSLDLDVREDVTLTEGFDFVPGAGSLGVGVDWALEERTELGELSEFYENGSGFHLLELVDRSEGGVFPFDQVRDQIEATLRAERRKAAARTRAEEALAELDEPSIEALADATGWPIGTTEPFGRRDLAPGLGRGTEAVGAAFAAPVGSVVGPFDAGDHLVLLRADERTEADAEMFRAMRSQLKNEIAARRAQERAVVWLESLRENAVVVDHRDRLDRTAEEQPEIPPMI